MSQKVIRLSLVLSILLNLFLIGYIALDYHKNRYNPIFNEGVRLDRYKAGNYELKGDSLNSVVFIGNSIFEYWPTLDYSFFNDNKYISRGVGGQTSGQILLRFQQDVIDLHPKVVVIEAGINDISSAGGTYDQDFTFSNIKSMVQLAEANGITVVLCSLLPAEGFDWKPYVINVTEKVIELNAVIENFAHENNYIYVDVHTPLKDEQDHLQSQLTYDGLHPNKEGYKQMEIIIKPVLDSIFASNTKLLNPVE